MLALAAAAVVAITVVVNAVAYRRRSGSLRLLRPCDRPDPLGGPPALLAFVLQCAAWLAVQGLRPLAWTRDDSAAPAGAGTVVLIHDLGRNAGSLALLRRRLRRSGWRTVPLRYATRRADAAAVAAELHRVVERIAAERPRQIILVGHGFGGLIARVYVRRHRAALVRRILTLGTAHQGTSLPTAGAVQRPDGALLSQLRAADRVPQQFDVISLYSTFDATVLPPANAEYTGAFNIRVNDVGHDSLLFSAKVYELVEENLAA